MAMIIKNNMSALNTLNKLNENAKELADSLKKVSSGMKINSAGDDASGYAISERMRVQMRGLSQNIANTQNGVSMLKVAEGGVQSTVDILKTLKEKAINAANDTNTDIDRATIQKEVDQSIDQINDNANITFNGMRMLDGAAEVPAANVQEIIVDALASEWIENALEQIEYGFGLKFGQDGTTVNEMDVKFTNESSTTLAYVTNSATNGEAKELSLSINMDYYENMDWDNVNGSINGSRYNYLDRTIVHEMTHAVMAANIKNFNSLPSLIKEGAAELIHGIDDARYNTILRVTNSASNLNTYMNNLAPIDPNPGTETYAAGYVYLRYLTAQSAGRPVDVMKRFMTALDRTSASGQSALDEAIGFASKGHFSGHAALLASMTTDYNAAGSNTAFLEKYCDIRLENGSPDADTGSLAGWDASGTEVLNAEATVTEAGSTKYWKPPLNDQTHINGLTVRWPAGTTGQIGTQVLQVGTKANQVIKLNAFDMRAKAIGVQDEEGNAVSVRTRAAANRAISRFDKALQRALDAQTTIGALQSRLTYTALNLTTASENVQNSESVVRDADMAKEMTAYTKSNVLIQTAQSMLAQANQNSSAVLSLLQ